MSDNRQQRFHGHRSNSMRLGLRGLLFTTNAKQEQRALREIQSLVARVLAQYPEEMFASSSTASVRPPPTSTTTAESRDNDENGDEKREGNDDDENEQNDGDVHNESTIIATSSSAGCFADELRMELEGMKGNKNGQQQQQHQQQQEHSKQQHQQQQQVKRFRIVDTNCKGYVFASINFATIIEQTSAQHQLLQKDQEQQHAERQAAEADQQRHVLDIAKAVCRTVAASDVPLVRFTYYLFPVINTVAPTLTSAVAFADAVQRFVSIPAGKSAAKIETFFSARNNSGVSGIVLGEMKKAFHAMLPSNKFFVLNNHASGEGGGGGVRRQRHASSSNKAGMSALEAYAAAAAAAVEEEAPPSSAPQEGDEAKKETSGDDEKNKSGSGSGSASARKSDAHVNFIVLHSVAMLAIQLDATDMSDYGLHKLGASFADSMTSQQ